MDMKFTAKGLPRDVIQDLENKNHTVSMLVSVVALGLMAVGFVAVLIDAHHMILPGPSALPLVEMITTHLILTGLAAMTLGVMLLAVLPAARIFWAIWIYFRARSFLDVLVAIVVLAELFFSASMGQ